MFKLDGNRGAEGALDGEHGQARAGLRRLRREAHPLHGGAADPKGGHGGVWKRCAEESGQGENLSAASETCRPSPPVCQPLELQAPDADAYDTYAVLSAERLSRD